MVTESIETEKQRSNSNTLIYTVHLDNSKKLYDLLDKVCQHWGCNSFNYDMRVFLPAQELIVKEIKGGRFDLSWATKFFELAKPIAVRLEITQLKDGDPMAMSDLSNKLKADRRWSVTPIKETVGLS